MSTDNQKPERSSFLYRLAILLSAFLFNTFFPVRYHNDGFVEPDAPYILISNHLSMWDPLILGYGIKRYQIRFLGKSELVQNPLFRFMFRKLLMISVRRHNTDMQALRACLKVLNEGHVLGIFPEGTRHKTTLMEDLEGGIAMIALRSSVPVLPVYIQGRLGLFRRAECYFGEPMSVSDIRQKGINKETTEEVLQRIRDVYRKMEHESAQTLKK